DGEASARKSNCCGTRNVARCTADRGSLGGLALLLPSSTARESRADAASHAVQTQPQAMIKGLVAEYRFRNSMLKLVRCPRSLAACPHSFTFYVAQPIR